MVRFFLRVLLCSALLLLFASSAAAQDDTARASALIEEAIAAFQQDDFATAATRFREAHELVPNPSLKLNEMVAWYKADRCAEAEAAAAWVEDNTDDLEGQDRQDFDRVTSDCAYRAAEAKFDAGDLAASETILNAIRTNDESVKIKVATLRGKIEERQKTIAEQKKQEELDSPPPVPVDPVQPPSDVLKYAGFGLIAAGALTLPIKVLGDWGRLLGWKKYWESKGCSVEKTTVDDCDDPATTRGAEYQRYKSSIERSNMGTAAVAVGSGIAVAGGLVLLWRYYVQRAGYREFEQGVPAEQTQPTAILTPVISPQLTGFSFHLSF